ncbi:MAG: hypothetical protein HY293_13780 [Planctomycetes bacterium]|nr:hypothetical protein [Planctomycetota bacterium]
MDEAPGDLPWTAAQRVEAWAGELRVNVIRLAAIVAFYGHHLFNQYVLKQEFPPRYTLAVTGIAVVWAVGALALHVALTGQWMPAALRFVAVGFDTVMITSLLLLSDGPRSPLLVLLFLVVATAPLRIDLRLVWMAALLALLSYAFVCGHAKWRRPEWQVPRRQQVGVALALAAAGFLAGQQVRQARRFAQDYADRVRPEDSA